MTETTHEALVRQTTAAEALLAYFQGQRDGLQADIGTAQAAYAALAANLKGVVADQMYFPATVDPDEPNPTNVRGGTFTTLAAAVGAAPSGAYVVVTLAAGKIHSVNASFWITSKTIVVVGAGGGGGPVLLIGNASNGTSNVPFRMNSGSPSSIRFSNVHIEYADKADAGLPWAVSPLVAPSYGTTVTVSLYGCTVTGHAEAFLSSTYPGSLVLLNLSVVTLDGVNGVQVSLGTLLGSKYNVSLLNGSAIQTGGTSGTNVFIN